MTQFAKNILVLTSILALAVVSACDKSDSGSDEEQAKASAAKAQPQEETAGEEASATDEDAQPGQSPTSLDELPEGVNVVQNEMQLLTAAMQNMLVLIANDQLEGIPAQIKKVHPAKVLTGKALEKGVYAPPKNSEKIEEFIALDEAFHDHLRGLIKASKADDLQMATDKYGDLVQGCTSCHTKFRY